MAEKNQEKTNQFDDKLVRMSNALVRKNLNITHRQSKLFMAALSQLDPFGKNDPVIRLNKRDLFEKLGIEKDTGRYMIIKKDLRMLVKESFVDLTKTPEDGDWYGKMGVLFKSLETSYKSPEYQLKVNEDFLSELQYLKKNYTTMELDEIISFDSLYTHRLYQYICSWNDKGECFLTTDQLREIFGLEKEDYVTKEGRFQRYNFEKRTLDVAIEEINEKTKIRIGCEKFKKGRLVKGYDFFWGEKEELPGQLTLEDIVEHQGQKINWQEFESNPNVNQEYLSAIKTVYDQVMRAKATTEFTVDGNRMPATEVRAEFEKITSLMIEQVLYDIAELEEVKNLRNWLLTTLYNAPINSLIKLDKQVTKDHGGKPSISQNHHWHDHLTPIGDNGNEEEEEDFVAVLKKHKAQQAKK